MDTKPKTLRVIIFLLATLLILVTLYLLVFRVDFSGSKTLKVRFDYIGTIQVGSPVRKSGVKVGSVRAIEIDPADQRTVFVTLALYPGQIVRESDKVSIVSGGILGDQYVEIFPGNADASILPSGTVVAGQNSIDLHGLEMKGQAILGDVNESTQVLASFLKRNQAPMDRIVANIDRITTNLAELTDKAKSLEPLFPYLSKKVPEIGDQLAVSLKSFSSLSTLLSQPQTLKNLNQTLTNIRDVTDNLKKISDELEKSLK